MPSYSGVWTLPAQMQAVAAGNWQFPELYWIATLGVGGGNEGDYFVFSGVAVDSDKNVYSTSSTSIGGVGGNDWLISKHDTNGSLLWQRAYGNSPYSDGATGAALDSSGNLYVSGGVYDITYSTCFNIIKCNSSGALQWQKFTSQSSAGYNELATSVAVDSSSNIYVSGYGSTPSYGWEGHLFKYDTSGNLVWQRELGSSSSSADYFYKNTVDSSGNIYCVGITADGAGGDFLGAIVKFDPSGNITWQRRYGAASSYQYSYDVAVDSSNNVYVCGSSNAARGGANNDVFIVKYDSAGTLLWQRSLAPASGSMRAISIATGVSGDVYISGDHDSNGFIAKYDSSGTIQWQRSINVTSIFGTMVDSPNGVNDVIYLTGRTNASGTGYDQVTMKLPGDGSFTGVYGYWTFAASSYTDSALAYTSAASAQVLRTSTTIAVTPTFTYLTSSLTPNLQPL